MKIYVIGDLHLSGSVEKPMGVFGLHWENHHEKIEYHWKAQVRDEDLVLVPGDISWAMRLEEAMIDLQWIHQLPGKKVLLRGNHDYWWGSVTKLNHLFQNMFFLQNNSFQFGDYSICGTRGWLCANPYKFDAQDEKVYNRELQRLKLSLESTKGTGKNKIIVMTHYPPTNDKMEPSGFTEIYEAYGVEKVVYGHLHGSDGFRGALQGIHKGVQYYLTSCDFLDFKPLRIVE
ncbi:hypothetical protein SAMN02745975_01867 [Geosporobacter subterraneus DSM 17957]|uniref:Calcineurin-like phosphoesterase domain-containing protein n=1 Tax=Geosporobacter subterraneus DSM 17957 TaxID=1121919 RepID=A0A1M6II00_9FIRM|nr:metallophosphoesterase [Geosporobacter subterraneus]SHJ34057.1 hypothetical protein SAMN02745975_01867 [Geosporobacter subterraneus DSM 17957]